METPATYLQLGFLQISVPNLVLLAVMVGLFVVALLVPFPGGGDGATQEEPDRG
ncbi:MAG: hypothetical protein M3Z65_01080 [Chloroflexota bacterium]|nr:hypothetical protein [Chloroflexota bacterium]